MERSDKQIAAEFDAYCASAKANRRFNETLMRFSDTWSTPEEKAGNDALAKTLERAVTEFQIYPPELEK